MLGGSWKIWEVNALFMPKWATGIIGEQKTLVDGVELLCVFNELTHRSSVSY